MSCDIWMFTGCGKSGFDFILDFGFWLYSMVCLLEESRMYLDNLRCLHSLWYLS